MNANDVYVYVEGGVVHDVVCPPGIALHVIDTDIEGLDADAHDQLCQCDAYDEEHWHGTYGDAVKPMCVAFEDGRVSA